MPYKRFGQSFQKGTATCSDIFGNPWFSSSYGRINEQITSYRSDMSSAPGDIIPDLIADPAAWFLVNSMNQRRKKAIKKYGTKRYRHKYAPRGTNLPILAIPSVDLRDTGHTFDLKRETTITNHMRTDYTIPANYYGLPGYFRTGGPILAGFAEINTLNSFRMPFKFQFDRQFGRAAAIRSPDVEYFSNSAITKLAPNRPQISLTAILGELKEGLPSIPGILLFPDRLKQFRRSSNTKLKKVREKGSAAGSEYLNVQFGALPLLRDIQAVATTLMKVSEVLAQYDADASKGIRRGLTLKETRKSENFSSDQLSSQGLVGVFPEIFPNWDGRSNAAVPFNAQFKSTIEMSSREKIWFSGSFSYFLPMGNGLSDKLSLYKERYARLFGPGLTIEDIWQLTPWSWFVDWIFDIKSTISAHQRFSDDKLVMNYGYLMHEVILQASQVTVVTAGAGYPTNIKTVRTDIVSHSKVRYRANPYGFGVKTPGGFSSSQSAILAAVAISRS